MTATGEHVRLVAPKTASKELIEAIFVQPYCRIGHLVERGIAKRQAASTYLRELAAHAILTEEKAGRDKLFLNTKYLQLLASDGHSFEPFARPHGDG
jgi:hypothetical protein